MKGGGEEEGAQQHWADPSEGRATGSAWPVSLSHTL